MSIADVAPAAAPVRWQSALPIVLLLLVVYGLVPAIAPGYASMRSCCRSSPSAWPASG